MFSGLSPKRVKIPLVLMPQDEPRQAGFRPSPERGRRGDHRLMAQNQ